jgi:hypothetical protein
MESRRIHRITQNRWNHVESIEPLGINRIIRIQIVESFWNQLESMESVGISWNQWNHVESIESIESLRIHGITQNQ